MVLWLIKIRSLCFALRLENDELNISLMNNFFPTYCQANKKNRIDFWTFHFNVPEWVRAFFIPSCLGLFGPASAILRCCRFAVLFLDYHGVHGYVSQQFWTILMQTLCYYSFRASLMNAHLKYFWKTIVFWPQTFDVSRLTLAQAPNLKKAILFCFVSSCSITFSVSCILNIKIWLTLSLWWVPGFRPWFTDILYENVAPYVNPSRVGALISAAMTCWNETMHSSGSRLTFQNNKKKNETPLQLLYMHFKVKICIVNFLLVQLQSYLWLTNGMFDRLHNFAINVYFMTKHEFSCMAFPLLGVSTYFDVLCGADFFCTVLLLCIWLSV